MYPSGCCNVQAKGEMPLRETLRDRGPGQLQKKPGPPASLPRRETLANARWASDCRVQWRALAGKRGAQHETKVGGATDTHPE